MRTRILKIVYGLLSALCIHLVAGCGDRQACSSQSTSSQKVNGKENTALKELEEKIGIVFPSNTFLINATDGGGRDPNFGFYAWSVFSPAAIKIPSMKDPSVMGYLNLPVENTVEFVQGMIRNRKISQPLSAYGSEWERNGYLFRGTLVRTKQGDYLVIEQFRKK
jgi:hypothetical protein